LKNRRFFYSNPLIINPPNFSPKLRGFFIFNPRRKYKPKSRKEQNHYEKNHSRKNPIRAGAETTEKTETKVTIHIPENVDSVIKQLKINRIYELLKPEKEKSA